MAVEWGRKIKTIVLILSWPRNVVLKSVSPERPWRQEGTSGEGEIEAVSIEK